MVGLSESVEGFLGFVGFVGGLNKNITKNTGLYSSKANFQPPVKHISQTTKPLR